MRDLRIYYYGNAILHKIKSNKIKHKHENIESAFIEIKKLKPRKYDSFNQVLIIEYLSKCNSRIVKIVDIINKK